VVPARLNTPSHSRRLYEGAATEDLLAELAARGELTQPLLVHFLSRVAEYKDHSSARQKDTDAEDQASVRFNLLLWDDDFRRSLAVRPEGVSRSFRFRGSMWDLDRRIDGKPGTFGVYEDDVRARRLKTEGNASGSLYIAKEAEPEEGDAFRALIYVTRDVADTVDHIISVAHVQDRLIGVELEVALDGLPTDRGRRVRFCAEDIDLSDSRRGDILRFDLWPSTPDRISQWAFRDPAINFSVVLSEGSWYGNFPTGSDNMSCTGVITRSPVPQMIARSCKIEFREYTPGIGGPDPFVGEFRLEYGNPEIKLFCRRVDLNRRSKLLIESTRASLFLGLAVDQSKLRAKLVSMGADDVTGRITHCSVIGHKRFEEANDINLLFS
jgi:hypothetical protein